MLKIAVIIVIVLFMSIYAFIWWYFTPVPDPGPSGYSEEEGLKRMYCIQKCYNWCQLNPNETGTSWNSLGDVRLYKEESYEACSDIMIEEMKECQCSEFQ